MKVYFYDYFNKAIKCFRNLLQFEADYKYLACRYIAHDGKCTRKTSDIWLAVYVGGYFVGDICICD